MHPIVMAPVKPTPALVKVASLRRNFRLSSQILLGSMALALGNSGLQAQEAAAGTVEGRVQNASNGAYLPNAVVRVEGTNISAVTNNFGEFTLRDVPAGEANLRITYSGQEDQNASVNVTAGGTVFKSVTLGDQANVNADGTITLNEFVVQSERFKNAADIAINAERQSINIKNVVSTEEFGEIPGGNVGEFIKFLPGVELTYGGTYTAPTDAMGISVRGFGAEDTAIMIDGVPVTSASQGSLTNQVELDMLSINNASRVELIKVATPDMPMNSVGGQINLISKSAFEYAKPAFSYKAYIVVNSANLNPFDKVAGATDKKVYAGQPGFELSYIKPINEKLGLSLTASRFSQYSANARLRPEFGISNVNLDLRSLGGANGTPATNSVGPISATNPFLTRVSATDAPRSSVSNSASMKVDWKPLDGLSLTGNFQYSTYDASDTERRTQIRIQRPIDWGSDYTYAQPYVTSAQSASGSSYNPGNSVAQDITARDKSGTTLSGYVKAVYKKGAWDVTALASNSRSRASFEDFENGHFSGVDVSVDVGTIKFDDINNGIPGKITVYDRTGLELKELDYTQIANWKSPTIQGKRGNAESEDENKLYQLDLRRELDFIPTDVVKLAFKAGYRYEESDKIKWGLGTGYRQTYTGPSLTAAQLIDDTYGSTSLGWGQSPQQFVSTYKLYDIYQANPEYFTETESDAKENYWSALGQNKALIEKTEGMYAQIEGSSFSDRLHFVAGLRDETKTRDGYGPQGDSKWNYVKNADGSLYRNPTLLGTTTGTVKIDSASSVLFATTAQATALRADLTAQGIEYPTAAVLNGSLAAAKLQRKTGTIHGESSGSPNYSISTAYDVTKKLVAKVAYSVSSGRIKIEDGVNGLLSGSQNDFVINENEDENASPKGTIKVANPNLLPESSTNWDFELSYYTDMGGKLSGSYYLKNIKNFTQTYIALSGTPEFDTVATSLGLDPVDYAGWQITTTENGIGTGKVWGCEFQASQDLRFIAALGDLGRKIRFFGSFSHSERQEENTNRISARPSASNLASGGIIIAGNRFSVNVRASWKEDVFNQNVSSFKDPNDPTVTVAIGEFAPAALRLDVSANYQINPSTSVYISARNILEEGNEKLRYDALGYYPAYAQHDDYRDTGVQITFGVSGKF